MNRAFSTREKVMLVVLCFLIIGIAYYKFFLEPINTSTENYQTMAQDEQNVIMMNSALIQKKKAMEAELEEIFASGTPTPIPSYDNSGILMVELHSILDTSVSYTLSFGDLSPLSCGYLVRRPVQMKFVAGSYEDARRIINRIHESDNLSQISNLSISRINSREAENEGAISVEMMVTYFELS